MGLYGENTETEEFRSADMHKKPFRSRSPIEGEANTRIYSQPVLNKIVLAEQQRHMLCASDSMDSEESLESMELLSRDHSQDTDRSNLMLKQQLDLTKILAKFSRRQHDKFASSSSMPLDMSSCQTEEDFDDIGFEGHGNLALRLSGRREKESELVRTELDTPITFSMLIIP